MNMQKLVAKVVQTVGFKNKLVKLVVNHAPKADLGRIACVTTVLLVNIDTLRRQLIAKIVLSVNINQPPVEIHANLVLSVGIKMKIVKLVVNRAPLADLGLITHVKTVLLANIKTI